MLFRYLPIQTSCSAIGFTQLLCSIGVLGSEETEMDDRRMALVRRHWYQINFLHFPFPCPDRHHDCISTTLHQEAGSKGTRSQTWYSWPWGKDPVSQDTSRVVWRQHRVQTTRQVSGDEADLRTSRWVCTGPRSVESIANQHTVVARLKGSTPMMLLKWGSTPLCLQNLPSIRETHMQCWF